MRWVVSILVLAQLHLFWIQPQLHGKSAQCQQKSTLPQEHKHQPIMLQWITEWVTLEGTSKHHHVQPPAQEGPPKASWPGTCPDGFWVSPKMATLQPVITAYARRVSKLAKHDSPLVNLCWPLLITFMTFMWLEMVSRISCFITFLGSRWGWLACSSACPPSCPSWRQESHLLSSSP